MQILKKLMLAACVPVLLIPGSASAYIRINTGDPAGLFDLKRADSTAIQFYLNANLVPGVTSTVSGSSVQVIPADSDPAAAIRAALTRWANVTTASTKFLPLLTTPLGIDATDFKNVVAIAADSTTYSALNGVLALTVNVFVVGSGTIGPYTVTPGDIIDSDIIINPKYIFSTTGASGVDFQSVMTHELGHSLGANHTVVLGATMFQQTTTGQSNQRNLTSDDITFLNTAYPKAAGGAPSGKITGNITLATGAAVGYPLVTAIDVTSGTIIGGLGGVDGIYSLQVPPGTYFVVAEPFNLIQPVNLYFTAVQTAAVTKFQAAMLGGALNPTPVRVLTAGDTATANISVIAGATTLSLQSAAFGAAGGAGDVLGLAGVSGPILAPSGKNVDFVFHGPGLIATLTDANFKVFGQGITLVAGSVRADTRVITADGLPYMRATLNIPARETQGLASIFITSGTNTLALSGALVLGAPAPVFTVGGVVNGASFASVGVVAPGEIATIFGTGVGPTSISFAEYSSAAVFSKNTGDTRVLFDGIPASLIYSLGVQTTVVVPYSVAGKQSTSVVVEYQGVASAPIVVPVRATAPGLFLGAAAGQAAAFNRDSKTVNTAATPEVRDAGGTGVVVLYMTGEGQTSPAGTDGLIATTVFPKPVASVSVSINGQTLPAGAIKYYGAAPFLLAGMMQMNVEIPASFPAGAAAVVVTIGGVASPAANIFVK